MAELLLELFSEEIPARMQARAADDLKRLVLDGLKDAGLEFGGAKAFVTPRRLALVVDGLPTAQPDVTEERRGPKVDAPEKAVAGFKGSLPEGAKIEERETPKGTFFFAVIDKKGRAAADVLVEVLEKAVAALPWPKSQRWGGYPIRWVRPLHSIIALFDGQVVDVAYGPVKADKATLGHRFLSPDAFDVANFADYQAKLKAAHVVLDPAERRKTIQDGAENLAAAEGLRVKEDEGLLQEVTGLVEWPVVLMGRIDDAFMDVPAEVLSTAMRSHQKYFSVLDKDGALAARFIVVANTEASDGNAAIVAGNERVLRARLSDAKFFWDQDRKKTLESRNAALAESVFHAKLGSMFAKVERVEKLARELCRWIPDADADKAARAARLSKADLMSEMVYEFPELQGIMGRYYALNDGEDAKVADAVADHYAPQGPSDDCPTKPESIAVALADKIDTLAGFFAIDEKPTGSKDPFALRRAALGVIRLILENNIRLGLIGAFQVALSHFYSQEILATAENTARETPTEGHGDEDAAHALLAFFADRLKVHLKERGVRHDLISAIFALGGEDDLVRLLARVDALGDFLETDDGANLLTAYRRASNIVRIEEKKDKKSHDGSAREDLLTEEDEGALFHALEEVGAQSAAALSEERFADAMAALARLRGPVDAFFDNVTVNCEDAGLRENRLRLLSQIRAGLGEVADFSMIEG